MDSLSTDKKKILQSFSRLRTRIEKTGSGTLKGELEKLSKKVDDFFNAVADLEEKQRKQIQELQTEVSDLKKKWSDLKKKVSNLEIKVFESEEKIKSLAEAQATWMWESHATRFVISQTVKQRKFAQYCQMKKCLEKEKKCGKDAQPSLKRWEKLQNALGLEWTEDCDDLVKEIRVKRNSAAHPTHIDLDEVKESLKDNATDEEKVNINALFDMLKLAASLMKCGKLANDFLKNRSESWFQHISFSEEQENALQLMADWDRDLQHVQNGRLHSMTNVNAMYYLKKYVHESEYPSCVSVVEKIQEVNRYRLGNLAWEFEEHVVITQEKEWSPEHNDALAEMKRLVMAESRNEDVPDPDTAKCIIPDFLDASLWSCAMDIVEWFETSSTK